MEEKKIIAVRYKKHAWIFVVLSLLWLILYFSVEVPKYAQGEANGFLFWLITVLMLCFLFMSVCVLLVPKTAVTKEGETLVLHEIFRKKVIPLDAIKYVSFDEIGTYRTRDWELDDFIVVKNDIRPLWIVYQKDGAEKKAGVVCENATAAAIAIETLLEKRKKSDSD